MSILILSKTQVHNIFLHEVRFSTYFERVKCRWLLC